MSRVLRGRVCGMSIGIGTARGVGRRAITGLLVVAWLATSVFGAAPIPVRAASYVVTNTGASGTGSLAEAVTLSNANDPGAGMQNTITFTPGLTGTITISSTLTLTKSVAITGTGASITVSGGCTGCGVGGSTPSGGTRPFTVNSSGVIVNLTALTITAGNATFGGVGGGIANNGTLILKNSTVHGNTSSNGGGGITNGSGTLTLINSTVSGNATGADSYGNGGGIANGSGTLTLINSTVSGNGANDHGGGIFNGSGTVMLTNSTVSGNAADADVGNGLVNSIGGGISNDSGTVTARNTIIAGNTALSDPDTSGTIGGSSNLIGVAVLLAPLGTYGGPTQTHPPLPGSPAINAGDALYCPTTDQRGIPRPQGTACDIGAVEVAATVYVGNTYGGPVRTTPDDTADCAVAANTTCTLRGALAYAVGPADTVRFGDAFPVATRTTITLTNGGGTLSLSRGATIDGTGKRVAISGGCTGCGTNSMPSGGVQVLQVNSGVTVNLTALTITAGNGGGTEGGGIVNDGGTLTLTNSTVSGNTAAGGGGIVNRSTLVLTNSTVGGNVSYGGGGGGIRNSGTLTITNSTMSNNTAVGDGGGIYNDGGTVALTNVTVSSNSAVGDGGGIDNDSGTVTARNTIVAGNTGGDTFGTVTDGGSSLIGGTVPLARLGDYGGPTQTRPPLPGSPAINAGNAGFCAASPVNNPRSARRQPHAVRGLRRGRGRIAGLHPRRHERQRANRERDYRLHHAPRRHSARGRRYRAAPARCGRGLYRPRERRECYVQQPRDNERDGRGKYDCHRERHRGHL